MNTKLLKALLVTLSIVGIYGCSSAEPEKEATKTEETKTTKEETKKEKEFDGSKYSETETGDFYIATEGGTSEDGKTPEFASSPDTLTSVDVCSANFPESTTVAVYIDGNKKQNLTLGYTDQFNQAQIPVSGNDLTPGTHTVEIVKMNGDTPEVYKKAEYKVIEQ